ncbi:phage head closure protein [Lactobacillus kefiranofaciens]|uniref:phage head closure protein n=1 Tax=Lactobacillus kefiranofaciens TaxID=267818 RepID=UPI002468EC39|nr:phage head closure protein [Lactobacillus kefiranofaciens]MDH5099754.1 phage head closure protein [Lactobacillus kefiranofaciens]
MVQLQNPDRLNQKISFGTVTDDEDANGVPQNIFSKIGSSTLCGRWSLTTNQIIQLAGLKQTSTIIVVVHHRNNWNGVTHAWFNGELYQVTNIAQDPFRNQTAYDLITLAKVGEQNG